MTVTAPLCAACMGAIVGTRKGKAVGTEVFHADCIQRGGVARSQLRQAQARARQLEADLAAARAQHEARRESIVDATRLVAEASTKLKEAKVTVEATRRDLRDSERERGRMFDAMADAKRERDLMVIERDAARRELALFQQLHRQPAPAPVEVETTAEPVEEIDGSKKRFELIELS